jgi:hypothetical protein
MQSRKINKYYTALNLQFATAALAPHKPPQIATADFAYDDFLTRLQQEEDLAIHNVVG